MNTILISQDFVPKVGGIARYLTILSKNYFGEVTTITDSKHPYLGSIPGIKPGISVNFQPFESFNSVQRRRVNKQILDFVLSQKPDMVIFGYIRSHIELYEELQNQGIRVGLVGHAKELFFDARFNRTSHNDSHKGYTMIEKEQYLKACKHLDFIITNSDFTKKILLNQGVRIPIFKIYPSLQVHYFPVDKSNQRITMLSVGRLISRKGQLKLLTMLEPHFMKENLLKYQIVGSGPDELAIKQMIEDKNLGQFVSLYTHASDNEIKRYYETCHFFILLTDFLLPNDVEGLGIVFLEAQAQGLPVIAGNSGGVPETFENEMSGFLVNPRNKDEVLTSIKKLCNDSELIKQMGDHAQKFITRNFSTKNDLFISFLKDLKNGDV